MYIVRETMTLLKIINEYKTYVTYIDIMLRDSIKCLITRLTDSVNFIIYN